MGKKALQFHRITPDLQLCGTWNTPEQFDRFLNFLKEQKIPVLLPDQPGSGIIITFDDGECSIYDHAFPLLKKYGMRAVVFLIGAYIGKENYWDIRLASKQVRHLSWEQIHEMSDWGIEFGSHTMTHRNLTHLPFEIIKQELIHSKEIIDTRIGGCRSVSYPFNRVNSKVLAAARSAGYTYGFGGDGTDHLLIKKEALYITDTAKSLQIKISERPSSLYQYERIKQKIINMFTISTMILKGTTMRSSAT